MNSRQIMARLLRPVRHVGAMQPLGCRSIDFEDSGHEHTGLPRGLPTGTVCSHGFYTSSARCPCRPGSGGQHLTDCNAQALCDSMMRH